MLLRAVADYSFLFSNSLNNDKLIFLLSKNTFLSTWSINPSNGINSWPLWKRCLHTLQHNLFFLQFISKQIYSILSPECYTPLSQFTISIPICYLFKSTLIRVVFNKWTLLILISFTGKTKIIGDIGT